MMSETTVLGLDPDKEPEYIHMPTHYRYVSQLPKGGSV